MRETEMKRLKEYIKLVQEWESSGMTQADFAAAKGIKLRTFEYRLQRVRKLAPESLTDVELKTVEFVPIPSGYASPPEPARMDSEMTEQPVLMIQSAGTCLQATNQIDPYLLKTAMEVMLRC